MRRRSLKRRRPSFSSSPRERFTATRHSLQPVFQHLIQNKLEDNEIEATFALAMSLVQRLKLAEHTDVRSDYLQLISRTRERIKSIDQALKP